MSFTVLSESGNRCSQDRIRTCNSTILIDFTQLQRFELHLPFDEKGRSTISPPNYKCTFLDYPQNVQTVPTHDSEGVVRID